MTLSNDFFAKTFLGLSWILFFCLFLSAIYPVGHLSDDFVVLDRALKDEPLWTIHYSYTLGFFWKVLTPTGFKLLALIIHLANCGLFFRFLRSLSLDLETALFGATLFLFSAAGYEAIIWNCCLGYLFTAFFLLIALNITDLSTRQKMSWTTYSFLMSVLQLISVMTWDWGVIITPICLAAILFSEKRKTRLFHLLPASLVLIAYLVFRMTIKLDAIYGKNSLYDMVKFFLGSPLLMLMPNMDREFFSSLIAIVLSFVLLMGMIYLAIKVKEARGPLAFLVITLLPWVIGGHPTSRYYYIAAPFLFVFVLLLHKQFFLKGRILLMIFLGLQIHFFLERAQLWYHAGIESHKIGRLIKKTYDEQPFGSPLVVVNVPDAFGPSHLPMRPQSWHMGIETFCKDIILLKTCDTEFIWKDEKLTSRERIQDTYKNAALYEVILRDENPYGTFHLVPFSK